MRKKIMPAVESGTRQSSLAAGAIYLDARGATLRAALLVKGRLTQVKQGVPNQWHLGGKLSCLSANSSDSF